MADLDDLLDRLSKAPAGSLILDAEIWCAMSGYEFVQWDGAGCVYREPGTGTRGIRHAAAREIKPFSVSIDAALTLKPKGCGWTVGESITFICEAIVFGQDIHKSAEAATPALALCIAALRAREPSHE